MNAEIEEIRSSQHYLVFERPAPWKNRGLLDFIEAEHKKQAKLETELNQLRGQYESLLKSADELRRQNKLLIVAARIGDEQICLHEERRGRVTRVTAEEVEIIFFYPNGGRRQLFQMDQFVSDQQPQEGDVVAAQIMVSAASKSEADTEAQTPENEPVADFPNFARGYASGEVTI